MGWAGIAVVRTAAGSRNTGLVEDCIEVVLVASGTTALEVGGAPGLAAWVACEAGVGSRPGAATRSRRCTSNLVGSWTRVWVTTVRL